MRLTVTLLAAAVLASPLAAQPAPLAPDYVKMAGASDLYEKTSSQMVLKDARNPKVKEFARMMVMDHNKSTADVAGAAKADGLKPKPPMLMPEHKQLIAELKAAKPSDREKVYLKQQVAAHEKALALHTSYSGSGDKPNLKAAAGKIVPVVQTHLTEVKAMAAM